MQQVQALGTLPMDVRCSARPQLALSTLWNHASMQPLLPQAVQQLAELARVLPKGEHLQQLHFQHLQQLASLAPQAARKNLCRDCPCMGLSNGSCRTSTRRQTFGPTGNAACNLGKL